MNKNLQILNHGKNGISNLENYIRILEFEIHKDQGDVSRAVASKGPKLGGGDGTSLVHYKTPFYRKVSPLGKFQVFIWKR